MCGKTVHTAKEKTYACETDTITRGLNAFDCNSQTARFHHWVPKINADRKRSQFFFLLKNFSTYQIFKNKKLIRRGTLTGSKTKRQHQWKTLS